MTALIWRVFEFVWVLWGNDVGLFKMGSRDSSDLPRCTWHCHL